MESVNHPADQIVARKLIAGNVPITPEQASNPSVDLSALVPRVRASVRSAT
ncbi:MAG: hypothetical protein ACREYB_12440 [Casimicrobiaceae bacterium]